MNSEKPDRESDAKNVLLIRGVKVTADKELSEAEIKSVVSQAIKHWHLQDKKLGALDISIAEVGEDGEKKVRLTGWQRTDGREVTGAEQHIKTQREIEVSLEEKNAAAKKKAADQQKTKEKEVPAVKDLPKEAPPALRYEAYAREARLQGCIQNTDKAIVTAMMKNGERPKVIDQTMKQSPAYMINHNVRKEQEIARGPGGKPKREKSKGIER